MGEDQLGGQDKEHMFKDSESMVKVCYHKQQSTKEEQKKPKETSHLQNKI
jgi:hypothetical protein